MFQRRHMSTSLFAGTAVPGVCPRPLAVHAVTSTLAEHSSCRPDAKDFIIMMTLLPTKFSKVLYIFEIQPVSETTRNSASIAISTIILGRLGARRSKFSCARRKAESAPRDADWNAARDVSFAGALRGLGGHSHPRPFAAAAAAEISVVRPDAAPRGPRVEARRRDDAGGQSRAADRG